VGFRNIIDTQLNNAFNLAQDLKTDMTLNKRTGVDYDFASGDVTSQAETNISVQGIIIGSKKKDKKSNTTKRQLMLKRKDVGDITEYDTVSDAGGIWKIGKPIKDDGFITLVEIYKEL